MVALDIRVTTTEGWDQWQWWRLSPRQLHPGDVVDLGQDVKYSNVGPIKHDRSNFGNNPTSLWTITHVTLEGPGRSRIGFLPVQGHGGQIDLHFDHTDRLRVKR